MFFAKMFLRHCLEIRLLPAEEGACGFIRTVGAERLSESEL